MILIAASRRELRKGEGGRLSFEPLYVCTEYWKLDASQGLRIAPATDAGNTAGPPVYCIPYRRPDGTPPLCLAHGNKSCRSTSLRAFGSPLRISTTEPPPLSTMSSTHTTRD
jgi:hypothetical protein